MAAPFYVARQAGPRVRLCTPLLVSPPSATGHLGSLSDAPEAPRLCEILQGHYPRPLLLLFPSPFSGSNRRQPLARAAPHRATYPAGSASLPRFESAEGPPGLSSRTVNSALIKN